MKKKNTTDRDIEKAKTKADPTAAAQTANDEDIDNYMAAFDAKMEESLKKLETECKMIDKVAEYNKEHNITKYEENKEKKAAHQ